MSPSNAIQINFQNWGLGLTELQTQPETVTEQLNATQQEEYSVISPSQMQLIRISGDASHDFLQGQVSCDLNQLQTNSVTLGSYCNHQGRMLANFLLWHDDADFLLLLHHSLVHTMTEALHKYAQFSRVKVTAQPEMPCLFLCGKIGNAPTKQVASPADSTACAPADSQTGDQAVSRQHHDTAVLNQIHLEHHQGHHVCRHHLQ